MLFDLNVLADVLQATCAVIDMESGHAILAHSETDAVDVLRCRRALAEDEFQHRPADKVAPVGQPCAVPTLFRSVGGQS